MKNSFLLLMLIAVLFVSCRQGIVHKNIIIPANTEIKYLLPTDEYINGCLVLSGDTTGNGLVDVKVEVPFRSLMHRICFLRQIYPSQDIIIIVSGNVSLVKGMLVFDHGRANVPDRYKINQ